MFKSWFSSKERGTVFCEKCEYRIDRSRVPFCSDKCKLHYEEKYGAVRKYFIYKACWEVNGDNNCKDFKEVETK